MNKKLFWTEFFGVLFGIFAGSALHFVFEWSGYSIWTSWFAAVNESIWEHQKLLFFSALIYFAVEWLILKDKRNNLFLAKAVEVFVGIALIIGGFYGYTAIAGTNFLWADIGLFVLAVIIGKIVSYKILSKESGEAGLLPKILFFGLGLSFIIFTFYPPHIFLFRDSARDMYGAFIPEPVETDMIRISEPLPYDFIKSPLTVSGMARGNWYFEASFPVKIYDDAGNELGAVPVMAKDDWMTTEFVPFGGEISFSESSSEKGYVVFKKDNPSGLPEYDAEVRVLVKFR